MKQIYFEMLKLTAPSNGYKFKDHGFVVSIIDQTEKILSKHNIDIADCKIDDPESILGVCLTIPCEDYTSVEIYYSQFLTFSEAILVRFHEEGHAIYKTGNLDMMTQAFLENQNVKINFDEIKDEEVIAELITIYGLLTWKIPIDFARDQVGANDMEKAIKIYELSKI